MHSHIEQTLVDNYDMYQGNEECPDGNDVLPATSLILCISSESIAYVHSSYLSKHHYLESYDSQYDTCLHIILFH